MVKADFGAGRVRAAVALIAAGLLAAGCSSSGSTSSDNGGGAGSGGVPKTIAEALKGVHATADTSVALGWGQYAYGGSSGFDEMLTPVLGFSVAHQPFTLTTGLSPTRVNFLFGAFDPDALGAKLQAIGYKRTDRPGGEVQWLVRDDHQMDVNQKPEELSYTVATFNVIRISKTRIVFGGSTADLDAATSAAKPSLADDHVVGELATCMAGDASGMYSAQASQMAIGIGPNGTETICVAAPDDATAKKYGEAFTAAIATGTSNLTMTPWKQMFSNPKVESLGGKAHVMRLTVTDADPTHPQLENTLIHNETPALIGLPVQLGIGRTPPPFDGAKPVLPTASS